MNLFQINSKLNEILLNATVGEDTGEILMDLEAYEALQLAAEEKKENILLALKNLIGEKKMVDDEAAAMRKRSDTIGKMIDRLKDYSFYALNGESFSTGKVSASWRTSESVEFSDKSKIPEDYLKQTVTTTPDKTAIKKAIKAGASIEGAYIAVNHNLQIK